MKGALKIFGLVIVVQLVFVAVWWFGRAPKTEETARRDVVEVQSDQELDLRAPHLSYRGVSGGEGAISGTRDQPLVLHFWGTWCPPCVEELPRLLSWSESGEFELVAVALEDDRDSIQQFFDGDVPPQVVLPHGPIAEEFGARRLPVTLLVSPDGRLVRRWSGARAWTPTQRAEFLRRD